MSEPSNNPLCKLIREIHRRSLWQVVSPNSMRMWTAARGLINPPVVAALRVRRSGEGWACVLAVPAQLLSLVFLRFWRPQLAELRAMLPLLRPPSPSWAFDPDSLGQVMVPLDGSDAAECALDALPMVLPVGGSAHVTLAFVIKEGGLIPLVGSGPLWGRASPRNRGKRPELMTPSNIKWDNSYCETA